MLQRYFLHCCPSLLSTTVDWLLSCCLFGLQVKKIESYGSGSGRTSKKIVIADCGQLS